MSEDLWNHLSEAGIVPSEDGVTEIDGHGDVLNIEKSYFLGCLKFRDGCIAYKVYVTIDRQKNCDVDINELEFPRPVGQDVEARVAEYEEMIRTVFRSFCDGRSDLA